MRNVFVQEEILAPVVYVVITDPPKHFEKLPVYGLVLTPISASPFPGMKFSCI